MLHAPNTCVHECMRTCKPGPIWPMLLAKPAESLHERMHATRNIYKLLIPIKIGTRNIKIQHLCPSRGMCTDTVHSADMLACTCTHGWVAPDGANYPYIYGLYCARRGGRSGMHGPSRACAWKVPFAGTGGARTCT